MELSDLVGRRQHIIVSGQVEVSWSNLTPKLRKHVPQGINPRILLLDLTIVSSGGIGLPVVMYKSVQYTQPTSGNQYSEVDILFGGKIIKRIKVSHPKTLRSAAKKKSRKKRR
jgi:hypothetical protein